MSGIEDDAFLDVTCVQMEQEPPDYGEENVTSPESFSTDPLRTLGEILAYCQVMYGAIQKLDAKFELLKTSVTSFQQAERPARTRTPSPSCRGHTVAPNSPNRAENLQLKVEVSEVDPHPHQQGTGSPSPPDPFEGRGRPGVLPVPDDVTPTPPPTQQRDPPRTVREGLGLQWPNCMDRQSNTHSSSADQQGQAHGNRPAGRGQAHGNRSAGRGQAHGNPALEHAGNGTEKPSHPRWGTSEQRPPHTAAGNRKFVLPSSFLRKAGTMARPTSAARFLMRCVFSRHELLHGNTRGDPSRGLRRLDPDRLAAIREWVQKRYPKHDLHERGKDWRACLAVMNKATRYIRLMDRTRGLTTGTDMNEDTAPIVDVDLEPSGPITDQEPKPTAEIDVELSDSDTGHPQRQRAPRSALRDPDGPPGAAREHLAHQEPLVFLGSASRGVKVPQTALLGAWQRPRPPLVARFLIRFMFSDDVLVQSNVYGNTEHGIQPLDHNKISALREHLCERFHWMQLQEDGQDWKACVDAINSCIRKTRHKLKKARR